jgi:hypothetical protein
MLRWAEMEGISIKPKKIRAAKFETRWYIDADNTDVPDVIIRGYWTNPTNQKHYVPTHRQGEWGIYAEDYIDEYTRKQMMLYKEHCNRIMKGMRDAIANLYVTPIQIQDKDAFDDLSKVHRQYHTYVADCKRRITTAHAILTSVIEEPAVEERTQHLPMAWLDSQPPELASAHTNTTRNIASMLGRLQREATFDHTEAQCDKNSQPKFSTAACSTNFI